MDYRLYVFDGNHIRRAVDLEAEDDDAAIALAEAQCGSRRCARCEIWRRNHMLKALSATPGPPP